MTTSDECVRRPPRPACARTWGDFTGAMRELFAWCGRPKYATLSKASGLAPSNISNLIGKNPLQRPSLAATLRFVEACLMIGGYSPRAVSDSLEEWREAWNELESGDHGGHVPRPSPPLDDAPVAVPRERAAPPRGRAREVASLLLAAGAGALSVLVAGGTWLTWNAQATADQSPPAATSSLAAAAAHTRCQVSRIAPVDDVRTGRSWSDVLVCPNVVGAAIRLEPTLRSPVVGTLDYDSSWFVCWATGGEHPGGNRVWYYTKGDSMVAHPEAQKWGYVAASDLGVTPHPDLHALRTCPAG